MSILGLLFRILSIMLRLFSFSTCGVGIGALRFLSLPGINSCMPLPLASFSLGSLSWNLPREAVEAFATTAAVDNC